ncbi:hypothetical protein AGRA3207_001217 [Actinomadura graeca]|uniref:Secreted protein n=1 Tax=Actinomadura graeca TaxID=2750812 RepID=A0ABX8QPF4_9ACTN|nr:DUF6493 family protein [Actinomadura graeca]QXJ20493.1 hypothetical protein AGRA3207_001217 [Actinomadura graeca]
MSSWDAVRAAIDSGDLGGTARLVAALDPAGRRATATELPALLKTVRAASQWGLVDPRKVEPLLVAGAGAIGGAAAAAAWLGRRDLEVPWRAGRYDDLRAAVQAVTAARPDEWRAEVAHRVAARIRTADAVWRDLPLWHMAAALTLSAGAAPPVSDGFVVGWVFGGARVPSLGEDPFLDALVPRLFETDGAGLALALATDTTAKERDWIGTLVALAEAGRLERATLLDGCVNRFLRGGTAHTLRWFVQLHQELRLTDEESAARARDYVRLLPTAPPGVADLALRETRRADELGRLDGALFEEAISALLFRPEKKLVRATLTWLDRTARPRGRVDATLRAATAVFAAEALDLRERAVRIAVRHGGGAGAQAREEVRAAAADLPAGLRATVAAAFGPIDGAAAAPPVPAGPPPFVPRDLPPPIGSLAELVEEFGPLAHGHETWAAVERFLGALVEHAFVDFAATRDAFARAFGDDPWAAGADDGYRRSYAEGRWVLSAVRSLLRPEVPRVAEARAAFVRDRPGGRGTGHATRLDRFLGWRRRETAAAVGVLPVLLATPTEGSGHVDTGVLIRRLERLEEAGLEPGGADLVQAMLRVPRAIDTAAASRAGALRSDAGRAVASWLAAGGLGDPAVDCRILGGTVPASGGRAPRASARILATVDPRGDVPPGIARVCAFPAPGRTDSGGPHYRTSTWSWPAMFPSHREVAAAHLAPCLAGTDEYEWAQGETVLALAEADGPSGAATGTALALVLGNKHERERADAVEALLALSGRGRLPAAETGAAAGRLAALGRVKATRIARALGAAADAGAHADVWAIIAAALPALLPAPGARAPAGLPDLIALGTRTAELGGARGAIPALEAVASRRGSSRLVQEAAHLHRTLTTAHC